VTQPPPGDPPPADGRRRPALRTEPRPYIVHWMVDSLIGFLATVLVLWFFGIPLWGMIIVAWVIGFGLAPLTRKWETEQLAHRKTDGPAA
jgi:hypothetical protein